MRMRAIQNKITAGRYPRLFLNGDITTEPSIEQETIATGGN